ncbi:hypothetical protein TNCV_4162421 [Trichonephila clavipes]|nr:hypothetical protein TNCV_4162421 [Trichonephila clavipes]
MKIMIEYWVSNIETLRSTAVKKIGDEEESCLVQERYHAKGSFSARLEARKCVKFERCRYTRISTQRPMSGSGSIICLWYLQVTLGVHEPTITIGY